MIALRADVVDKIARTRHLIRLWPLIIRGRTLVRRAYLILAPIHAHVHRVVASLHRSRPSALFCVLLTHDQLLLTLAPSHDLANARRHRPERSVNLGLQQVKINFVCVEHVVDFFKLIVGHFVIAERDLWFKTAVQEIDLVVRVFRYLALLTRFFLVSTNGQF